MNYLENVSVKFHKTTILENISLNTSASKIAIVGPNGIGKTTILNLLSQEIRPISGEVNKLQSFSYFFQSFYLFPHLTLKENLQVFIEKDWNIELAKQLGIDHLKDKKAKFCSDGERQRAILCMAILDDKPILLLDEPTKYLDEKHKKIVLSILERLNKTTIKPTEKVNEFLKEIGTSKIEVGVKLAELLKRPELTYEKLQTACNLLQDSNLTYIGANPDLVFPVENGIFYPDCGSIAKMLFYSVKRFPKFLGKPHHEILDYCLEKKGVSKDETVIIGDRLYTDIACGQENGCDTILIFSGEARKEDLINSEYQPTLFLDSIKELKIK